jgi:hypothetical protein
VRDNALMSAEADAVCGAGYGERSRERVNSRNGYQAWEWDTRAGTVELAIPKPVTARVLPARLRHPPWPPAVDPDSGCRDAPNSSATTIRRAE